MADEVIKSGTIHLKTALLSSGNFSPICGLGKAVPKENWEFWELKLYTPLKVAEVKIYTNMSGIILHVKICCILARYVNVAYFSMSSASQGASKKM